MLTLRKLPRASWQIPRNFRYRANPDSLPSQRKAVRTFPTVPWARRKTVQHRRYFPAQLQARATESYPEYYPQCRQDSWQYRDDSQHLSKCSPSCYYRLRQIIVIKTDAGGKSKIDINGSHNINHFCPNYKRLLICRFVFVVAVFLTK